MNEARGTYHINDLRHHIDSIERSIAGIKRALNRTRHDIDIDIYYDDFIKADQTIGRLWTRLEQDNPDEFL
jgi:hypothetical protein